MQRLIILLLIVSLLFLAACTVEANVVQEPELVEDEEHFCIRGRTDDPYPGACHLYVDENSDGLCDYE